MPELLDLIKSKLENAEISDNIIKKILHKVSEGAAGYQDAYDYASHIGSHLADAFGDMLSSAVLPDGRMSYELAKDVIAPPLHDNYSKVADIAAKVQQRLNKEAGIGLKALTPQLEADKVEGILKRISSEENFDDVSWILQEPVKLQALSAVDDCISENADFQGKAGLTPKIVRKAEFRCCPWCAALAGSYEYPDVPKDVYRRHDNCRCTVDYIPDGIKKQNVHTKEWHKTENETIIETRKFIGLKANNTVVSDVSNHITKQITVRNVTGEQIKDAILNPLKVTGIKYDELGRPSFRIIGQKATLVVNPDTGTAVSVWPTHSKLAKRLKG